MSLAVWLPLTGDLHNQGLSNSIVINSGATVDNDGKIGKCYSLTNSNYLGLDAQNINNHKYSPISCALWIYLTQNDSTERYILGCWQNGGCGFVLRNQKIAFYVYTNGNTSCQTPTTVTLNTWYHICATYDESNIKLYLNGECVSTVAKSGKITYNETCPWEIGGNPGSGFANGNLTAKINDVRIYNHALSAKEVEEIAKGLILHYPLNDRSIEPTKNLVTGFTAGGQTTVSNNIVTTSGTNADTYFTINLSEDIVVGTQYTLSCYASVPQGGEWIFPVGTQSNSSIVWKIKTGYNEISFVANNISWGTKRIFMDDVSRNVRTLGQSKFYNFQLEKKDHATAFAGYGGQRGSNCFIDGYQKLEYLQSSGTQYIETGIVPQSSFMYKFKYAIQTISQYRGPFGAYSEENVNTVRIIPNNGSTTNVMIYFDCKASTGQININNLTTAAGQIIEGDLSKTSYHLTNLSTGNSFSNSNATDLFTTKGTALVGTMKLFGQSSSYLSSSRIYYFETYNGDSCIQKLIPVRRMTDNVLGFYDTINNQFFINAGTGTFTAGPIINEIIDTSGYSNNGIIQGELAIVAPSPRYNAASIFNAYNTPKIELTSLLEVFPILNDCTISWWENCSTTGNTLVFSGQSDYYFIAAGNSSTALYDGNAGTANIYVDGVLNSAHSSTNSGYLKVSHTGSYHVKDQWHHIVYTNVDLSTWTIFKINGYNSNWPLNAKLSDLRIYTTALTAAQVTELYNQSMIVDASGNVLPRELVN